LIGCIIQARTGSSRLPGKVLMKLDNELTVLEYVVNQLSFCKLIDKIIIATTDFEEDDTIEQLARKLQVDCFRGNSEDVLDRYYNCAKKFEVKNILRITSDCPLIDPEIVDKVIEKYLSEEYDYVSNTEIRTFPIGTDAEVFSFYLLEKSWKNASLPSEREHVTPYIRNKKIECKIGNLENTTKQDHFRLTLDRIEDLKLIKKIIEKISNRPILMKDVLDVFSKQPELIKINENIPQNEGMLKSLKRDKEVFRKED